jgi:phosphoribosylformimino-5-aminoimidazole carboxamide ribotide isomerase
MLLIPAIDLKDGHCVRLKQGDMDQSTTFGEDPDVMARTWLAQGARRLHLVDLNGAFAGQPKNEMAIRKILKSVGGEIDVQLGGGIRDLDTIERYLDDGLSFVIIGTAAVKSPGFLRDACTAFGGQHVLLADTTADARPHNSGEVNTAIVCQLAHNRADVGVSKARCRRDHRGSLNNGLDLNRRRGNHGR